MIDTFFSTFLSKSRDHLTTDTSPPNNVQKCQVVLPVTRKLRERPFDFYEGGGGAGVGFLKKKIIRTGLCQKKKKNPGPITRRNKTEDPAC